MSNAIAAPLAIEKGVLDAFFVGVSVSEILDKLHGDDLLLDDVSLVEITAEEDDADTTELEATLIAVNTEEETDPDTGEAYAIGEVFFFWLSGGTLGQTYRIKFLLTTTGSPAQLVEVIVPVEMVG